MVREDFHEPFLFMRTRPRSRLPCKSKVFRSPAANGDDSRNSETKTHAELGRPSCEAVVSSVKFLSWFWALRDFPSLRTHFRPIIKVMRKMRHEVTRKMDFASNLGHRPCAERSIKPPKASARLRLCGRFTRLERATLPVASRFVSPAEDLVKRHVDSEKTPREVLLCVNSYDLSTSHLG